MIREIRAEGLTYDASTDTARVKAPGAEGTGRLGLFDARGFLVGVDLRNDELRGTVVMLGPHEAVEDTREISARVDGDGVVIEKARSAVRGDQKSPYL